MNADERKKLLVESLREAAKQGEQERIDKATVARITAAVTAKLGLKAETSKPMSCPRCGEPLPESWRPNEITSDSDTSDDADNDGDDDDDRELDSAAKSRVVAELLRNHKRRR
jgi:hypothetical protein